MPYDLKEIAAISGMPGLYRLMKPTRAGVIIESLDGRGTRSVASARNKVSLLQEISIYTQDYDQTVPLSEVFDRIHQKYGTSLTVTNKSDDRDLTAFMGEIIPDYDRDRVYMSDIKKLVQWYGAVSSQLEYHAPAADEEATAATEAAAALETTATEPVAADAEPQAEAKPKTRSKKATADATADTEEKPAAKKTAKKKE